VDFKPKTKATANISKNRLDITISGNVNNKSLEALYTDVRFCVADLTKGFEVINDISQCNILYVSCFPVFKKITDYLVANNVGEIVRIVNDENISYKQLSNYLDKVHCYKTIYAASKKEAEEKLELLAKRNGVRFKIDNLFIEYEINDSTGKGHIIDISTSGCAVDSSTIPLSNDAKLLITLNFDEHPPLTSLFKIKAHVVRANGNVFATQFLDLDDEYKEQLYKRVAYEVSRSTHLH
jgi:hypothetical protein